jgi:hypothetical protein
MIDDTFRIYFDQKYCNNSGNLGGMHYEALQKDTSYPGPASNLRLQITASCWASGLLRDAQKPSHVLENESEKVHTYQ